MGFKKNLHTQKAKIYNNNKYDRFKEKYFKGNKEDPKAFISKAQIQRKHQQKENDFSKKHEAKKLKFSFFAQKLKIGENKTWIATDPENKPKIPVKITVKFFTSDIRKRIKVIISQGSHPEIHYKTDIDFNAIKSMRIYQKDEIDLVEIQTTIPTLFQEGVLKKTVTHDPIWDWKDIIGADWQDESINPSCNIIFFEIKKGKLPVDLEKSIAEADERIGKLLKICDNVDKKRRKSSDTQDGSPIKTNINVKKTKLKENENSIKIDKSNKLSDSNEKEKKLNSKDSASKNNNGDKTQVKSKNDQSHKFSKKKYPKKETKL